MLFKKVNLEDFYGIRQFYWDLIDEMSDQNDKIGWKKGIYPTDSFLQESLERGELFVPHALAVSPSGQGKGIGRYFMGEILKLAKAEKKKAVRLDILGTNTAAERLYKGCGFHFVQAKDMFYEDTGWTEYKMYESAVLFLSGRDRKTGKIISWKRRKRI
jgi:GNAT superfamily N-acetyltransferase